MVKSGYKHTEVGEIPEAWDVKKLGDLGSVVRGGSPRPAGDPRFFDGNFIPWLTVASLTNVPKSQIEIVLTDTLLTEEGSKRSRTLEKGTLIISNSGATLGVAKILGMRCCANDGIAALLNQKSGDKRYIAQVINTKTKYLHDVVASGNGQPNLNTSLIREIFIPYPDQEEQKLIADVLSDVDSLIAYLEKLIEKKHDIKTATMQQLLTGKKRLPGFEGQWVNYQLGEIGEFRKGKGIKKNDVVESGFPCIRYGEIYTRHHDYIKKFFSYIRPVVASEASPIRAGDLLFAGSGETAEEIGKCVAYLSDDQAFAGGDIVIYRAPDQDAKYLGFLMNHESVVVQKMQMGQGDAVVHIHAKNLANIEVSLPPIDEQQAISAVLSDMDIEIGELETRLAKTKAIKQGMMQELLTGRTRLV